MLNYVPLKLNLLPKGTFNKYLRTKEGIARIESIGMRKERLGMLLKLAEN
jgi:hypothetical protein